MRRHLPVQCPLGITPNLLMCSAGRVCASTLLKGPSMQPFAYSVSRYDWTTSGCSTAECILEPADRSALV